jgi:hypothetical protein
MANEKKKPNKHPEVTGLSLLAASLVVLLSLCTFRLGEPEHNCLGLVGHGLAWINLYLFGLLSYWIAAFLGYLGAKLLIRGEIPYLATKIFYFTLLTLSTAFLFNLIAEHHPSLASLFATRCYSETVTLKLPYLTHIQRSYLGGVPCYYLYRDLPITCNVCCQTLA